MENPYLFNEFVVASEYQKNMRTIELIIKESTENTIRSLLPIKEILKKHLDTYDTNYNESKKRIESNDLQQLLLNEIKNLKINKIMVEQEKEKQDAHESSSESE